MYLVGNPSAGREIPRKEEGGGPRSMCKDCFLFADPKRAAGRGMAKFGH